MLVVIVCKVFECEQYDSYFFDVVWCENATMELEDIKEEIELIQILPDVELTGSYPSADTDAVTPLFLIMPADVGADGQLSTAVSCCL